MNIFFGRIASVEWCDEHEQPDILTNKVRENVKSSSSRSKDSNQGSINVRRIADEEEHYEVSKQKHQHTIKRRTVTQLRDKASTKL